MEGSGENQEIQTYEMLNKGEDTATSHSDDDEGGVGIEQVGVAPSPCFQVFDVKQFNVLMIGQSGAGKTTLTRVLRDADYASDNKTSTGTKDPNLQKNLFQLNGQFFMLQMIDAPGFDEITSGAPRTSHQLKHMITECVKQNLTTLDLVLLVINGTGRPNSTQIKSLIECTKFLGKEASAKTCIAVSHFENKTEDDEKQWIDSFALNENMEMLMRSCKGGFLFTGALNGYQHANQMIKQTFVETQRRRSNELFKKLLSGTPINLMSEQMKKSKSMLASEESATLAGAQLQQLIPILKTTGETTFNVRVQISQMLTSNKIVDEDLKKRATDMIEKLGDIGTPSDDFKKLVFEDDLEELILKYGAIGKDLRVRHTQSLQLLEKWSALKSVGSQLLNVLRHEYE